MNNNTLSVQRVRVRLPASSKTLSPETADQVTLYKDVLKDFGLRSPPGAITAAYGYSGSNFIFNEFAETLEAKDLYFLEFHSFLPLQSIECGKYHRETLDGMGFVNLMRLGKDLKREVIKAWMDICKKKRVPSIQIEDEESRFVTIGTRYPQYVGELLKLPMFEGVQALIYPCRDVQDRVLTVISCFGGYEGQVVECKDLPHIKFKL